MSRTLEVFEHGKLCVTETGHGIRPNELEALIRFNDRHDKQYFEVGHKHLKARHFVGYLEVGDLSIEILPKADKGSTGESKVWREGLLEMLRVALGLRLDQLPDAAQKLTRSGLLDLIAQAYLAELELLLREGLAKGYRTTQSNGVVFRGRLTTPSHLRQNIARADRFYVEYQTFDHDIAINRVLAAALEALSWCGLSSSVACAVDACLARFPELQLRGVTSATLDRLHLTRATQRYAKALVYARMILAQQGPQLRSGADRVFALLFDMNALWERYVAVLLRRVAPPGIRVSTQEGVPFWIPHQHAPRRVRPDIVVRAETTRSETEPVLVIDTKWKLPSRSKPDEGDLKQMFVYNELLGAPRSMLLYPVTSDANPVTGRYADRNHTCEQWHLGVLSGATWSTRVVKQQLADLLQTVNVAEKRS